MCVPEFLSLVPEFLSQRCQALPERQRGGKLVRAVAAAAFGVFLVSAVVVALSQHKSGTNPTQPSSLLESQLDGKGDASAKKAKPLVGDERVKVKDEVKKLEATVQKDELRASKLDKEVEDSEDKLKHKLLKVCFFPQLLCVFS